MKAVAGDTVSEWTMSPLRSWQFAGGGPWHEVVTCTYVLLSSRRWMKTQVFPSHMADAHWALVCPCPLL